MHPSRPKEMVLTLDQGQNLDELMGKILSWMWRGLRMINQLNLLNSIERVDNVSVTIG